MGRSVVALFLLFALTSCGVPFGQSCAQQAAPGITQIQSIAQEWDDAFKLANSTPRATLPAQIGNLQAIRRKVQDVQMPECAALVKQRLIDAMDNSINGFIAFLGQKPDTEVKQFFDQANKSMEDFGKEIQALK